VTSGPSLDPAVVWTTPAGSASQPAAGAPSRWLDRLLDAGSVAGAGRGPLGEATVEGRPVLVHVAGRAPAGAVATAFARAVRTGRPVVTLHGLASGNRRADGPTLAAYARLASRVPHVAIVLGPCTGTAAALAASADVRVCDRAAVLALARADEVRTVTGEEVDPHALGGADALARRTGLADLLLDDEVAAIEAAKEVLAHLVAPDRPAAVPAADGDVAASSPATASTEIRSLLRAVLDGGRLLELQRWFAPNLVTGLARLGGRPVVVVATQPGWRTGALDAAAAGKAARAVGLCRTAGAGLLLVVDSSGVVPGVAEEHAAALRAYADLAARLVALPTPRVDLVVGRCEGLAGDVLLARGDDTPVLVWRGAGPLGAGRRSRAIDPAATRSELVAALTALERRTVGAEAAP
jgi:acetyl-CoA carboxylase carboxyltransferase component